MNILNHKLHSEIFTCCLLRRGFPDGLVLQDSACSAVDAGDVGSILESGRAPGEGNGNPPQDSCPGKCHGQEPGRLQSVGSQRAGHD